MPFAITLRVDRAAEKKVSDLWLALSAQGVSHDSIQLGYPAHLTLAICSDDIPETRLQSALEALITPRPIPLILTNLGLFSTKPAVIFLAPTVTFDLLAIHRDLLEALGGVPIHNHYKCGAWVPHITLAKDVASPEAAFAALRSAELPIRATLEKLEIVHFRPARILYSRDLAA